MNLGFAIYLMGLKIPIQRVADYREGIVSDWKVLFVEMRSQRRAETHAQKGHSCLKSYPYRGGPLLTVVRISVVPVPPPFKMWAPVSLQGEATRTVGTLSFKGMSVGPNT